VQPNASALAAPDCNLVAHGNTPTSQAGNYRAAALQVHASRHHALNRRAIQRRQVRDSLDRQMVHPSVTGAAEHLNWATADSMHAMQLRSIEPAATRLHASRAQTRTNIHTQPKPQTMACRMSSAWVEGNATCIQRCCAQSHVVMQRRSRSHEAAPALFIIRPEDAYAAEPWSRAQRPIKPAGEVAVHVGEGSGRVQALAKLVHNDSCNRCRSSCTHARSAGMTTQ
jgi:hypothetical protein